MVGPRPRLSRRRAPLPEVHGGQPRALPAAGPGQREQQAVLQRLLQGRVQGRAVPAQPPRLPRLLVMQPRLPQCGQDGHPSRPAA